MSGPTPASGHIAGARLLPVAALIMAIAIYVLGNISLVLYNAALEPELGIRSQLVGAYVRENVELALDAGVPLPRIAGATTYLESVLSSFPEVRSVQIRQTDGTPVVGRARGLDGDYVDIGHDEEVATDFRSAILSGNAVVGEILVEVDRAFLREQFTDVFLDIAVVVLVILLFTFEIVRSAVLLQVTKPLRHIRWLAMEQASGRFGHRFTTSAADALGRLSNRLSDHAIDLHERAGRIATVSDAALRNRLDAFRTRYGIDARAPATLRIADRGDIRMPLFLFATGEELSKPFLPLLVRNAALDSGWPLPDLIVSLPIVVYLLALMAFSSFAGRLASRFAPTTIFLVALAPVALSNIGLSFATSPLEFIAWRAVAGMGYALATIACQDYALRAAGGRGRAGAMSGFVATVIGGTFCGTAVGGILADRVGTGPTFIFGAMLVAAAAIVATRMMVGGSAPRPAPAIRHRGPKVPLFRNARFLALLFGIAIPMNVLMAAFLWYTVPLALDELGARPADIGRALMSYYLLTIFVAPWTARFVETWSLTAAIAGLGGLISGTGLLLVSQWYGFWTIVAAIAVAGVGHGMIRATIVSVAVESAEGGPDGPGAASNLSALRTLERAGSIVGLIATAMLAVALDYQALARLTGWFVLAGALAFLAVHGLWRRSKL